MTTMTIDVSPYYISNTNSPATAVIACLVPLLSENSSDLSLISASPIESTIASNPKFSLKSNAVSVSTAASMGFSSAMVSADVDYSYVLVEYDWDGLEQANTIANSAILTTYYKAGMRALVKSINVDSKNSGNIFGVSFDVQGKGASAQIEFQFYGIPNTELSEISNLLSTSTGEFDFNSMTILGQICELIDNIDIAKLSPELSAVAVDPALLFANSYQLSTTSCYALNEIQKGKSVANAITDSSNLKYSDKIPVDLQTINTGVLQDIYSSVVPSPPVNSNDKTLAKQLLFSGE